MIDARISVGLPAHPKTKKLIRRLDEGGAWRLVCLFLWVAQSRPDGDLSGMTGEDIELAADWQGEEGAFIKALIEVGFVDGEEGAYSIHDWQEHNPWAAGADARSEKSKWLALCKHHGRAKAAEMMPAYAARLQESSKKDDQCKHEAHASSASSMHEAENSSAPSPSPSPLPSPNVENLNTSVASAPVGPQATTQQTACPADAIVALYHEILPDNPRCKVLSDARRAAIRARWKEAAKLNCAPFGYSSRADGLVAWRRFFEVCAESDFLTGRAHGLPGKPPFVADIDFLMSPSGFAKTLENKYHREVAA
jgi:hypothetical protein